MISLISFALRRSPFSFFLMYVVEIGFSAIWIAMSSPYFTFSFSQVSSYSPISFSLSSEFSVMSSSALSGFCPFCVRTTLSPG